MALPLPRLGDERLAALRLRLEAGRGISDHAREDLRAANAEALRALAPLLTGSLTIAERVLGRELAEQAGRAGMLPDPIARMARNAAFERGQEAARKGGRS